MTQITMTGRRLRSALAAAGLATGLFLTACGGDDTTTSQDDTDSVTSQDSPSAEPMEEPETPEGTDDMEDVPSPDGTAASEQQGEGSDDAEPAAGTYREYDEDAVADPGYDTTVLFFHASWCPECRAFEESIEQGPIPDGVQILKVDYDSESDLKQKYDVTIQTTFVRVDQNGEALGSWVGYEQDRSVDTILSELE